MRHPDVEPLTVKVYIVRAIEGIGIIYGVFDSRECAEQYASSANVRIEEYEVSRSVKSAKVWIPWNEDMQGAHDLYVHGNGPCTCPASKRRVSGNSTGAVTIADGTRGMERGR